ncbi:MAG: peptidylprolyl isomerase [Planctomycetes bacterium]|nr:peptidylprolyl isomerase [Planctomycetota bacterium]
MRWILLPALCAAVAAATPDLDALRAQAADYAALHARYQQLLTDRGELKRRVDGLDQRLRALAQAEDADPGEAQRLAAEHEAAQIALAEFERPRSELWKVRLELEASGGRLEAALDAALTAEPDPELRLLRGELFARLERYAAALPDAEAAAFARPEDPRALVLLGRCAATQNRFKDAEGLFGDAVRLAPSAEAWALLAAARYCRNDFRGAREAYAHAAPEEVPPRLLRRCREWFAPEALSALEAAWGEEQRLRAAGREQPRVALTLGEREVVLELFADAAPGPVAKLLERVRAGKLSDVPVQRVLTNLAVFAGGSPRLDPAEQAAADPTLPRRHHFRGSVALEHTGDHPGYGPGIVVALTPAPRLDARHLVIGRVLSGQQAWDAAREGQRISAARVLE